MNTLTVNPILITAAVIPAVFLLLRVYKADRLDKEPPGLLLSLVLFGVIATFFALVAERLGVLLLSRFADPSTVLYHAILYFGVVAISEEGAKYILLKLRTWKSPHFNCQFDGVVYAIFVSLGFALWENIGYVLRGENGLATALVRAVTAVPGHACFGVFMGVFYGAAKRFEGMHKPQKSKRYRRLSLLFPILMHGVYDFIASVPVKHAAWLFVVFVIAMFISGYRLVRFAAADDQFITDPDVPDMPEFY